MLLGYDSHSAHADAGASGIVPSDGNDKLPADSAVPAPIDGGTDVADAASTSSDDDASLDSSVDAGSMSADDASTPLDDAAVADASTTDPPIPGCLGTPALGLCWHLGPYGRSCDEACDTYYDGFDERTVALTGKPSEGGSLANCQTVLVALGVTVAPVATYRPDGLGLGCHVFSSGATYWLDNRQGPFDSGDSLYDVRRACACVH